MSNKRIIISGGGTGGHVFPAIAIADALREKDPQTEILFVGADHKMEMDRVPEAGYSIIGLPVTGFQRRVTCKNIMFFYNLFVSMLKARRIIRDFRPMAVVGVGGYASGPVVRAAAARGIPVVLQEQNSYAGVTNRLLAKRASRICVAYEGMERYFPVEKLMISGNPVRRTIRNTEKSRDEALEYFGIEKGSRVILVVGGSLGAATINQSIEAGIEKITGNGVGLIWQTGRNRAGKAYLDQNDGKAGRIRVYEFISRMDLAYLAADLVISRAGALTISELALAAKPAILVPSPNVAEDHQTRNARALAELEAAVLVPDNEAAGKLVDTVLSLVSDDTRLNELKENIAKMGKPDAASIIAEEILNLIKK